MINVRQTLRIRIGSSRWSAEDFGHALPPFWNRASGPTSVTKGHMTLKITCRCPQFWGFNRRYGDVCGEYSPLTSIWVVRLSFWAPVPIQTATLSLSLSTYMIGAGFEALDWQLSHPCQAFGTWPNLFKIGHLGVHSFPAKITRVVPAWKTTTPSIFGVAPPQLPMVRAHHDDAAVPARRMSYARLNCDSISVAVPT